MADEVTEAVAAVKSGKSVYVSPGSVAPTDATLAALTKDDQIVLVVLSDKAGDPSAVLSQIDAATGSKKIVGLVIGEDATGHASRFEPGLASDIMDRATSISNTPQQALSIFVNKVHQYQSTDAGREAMRETSTTTEVPGSPSPDSGTSPVLVGGGIVLALMVVVVAASMVIRRLASRGTSLDALVKGGDRDAEALRRIGTAYQSQAATLPPAARDALDAIAVDLSHIAKHWDAVRGDARIGNEVELIAFESIPRSLQLWADLPEDLRNKVRDGRTAGDAVTEQFEAIERGLDSVKEAVYQGNLDALNVESLFMQDKYRKSSELDLGNYK